MILGLYLYGICSLSFGETETSYPTELKEVQMKVWDAEHCRNVDEPGYWLPLIPDSEICAYTVGKPEEDACYGNILICIFNVLVLLFSLKKHSFPKIRTHQNNVSPTYITYNCEYFCIFTFSEVIAVVHFSLILILQLLPISMYN